MSIIHRWDRLIYWMVGVVFLSEGLQKLLFNNALGAGRFQSVGVPFPEVIAPIVSGIEITCGVLLLTQTRVRWVVVPLFAIMLGAFGYTKLPILFNDGFWTFAHESRTDFCMTMGCLWLWGQNASDKDLSP